MTSYGVPYFNGSNYTTWKVRMKIYLQAINLDVWLFVDNGEIDDNFDKKVRKEIMRRLSKSDINFFFFKIVKEIWDKFSPSIN